MNSIKVIGIGSPFGNDNLGWRVIERLKGELADANLPGQLELITLDRPGINLIHLFAGAEFVMLVDAILDAEKHGKIIKLEGSQIISGHHRISSHDLDVTSAIALAANLHALPPRLQLIGLGVDHTPTTLFDEEPIIKLAGTILAELDEYLRDREPA